MFFTPSCLKALSQPVSQPFKRSQLGLFGGHIKRYGNNNPFSKKKTRRTWLPNVRKKGLHSDALGGEVRTTLTTRVLKTVKKVGGFDNYLLKMPHKVLGFEGTRLRIQVRDALAEASSKNKDDDLLFKKIDEPTLEDAAKLREMALKEMRRLGILEEGKLLQDPQLLIDYLQLRKETLQQ